MALPRYHDDGKPTFVSPFVKVGLDGLTSVMAGGLSRIAADAAESALKKLKGSSGRSYATSNSDMERLRRRSRKMKKDFEGAMEKSVKTKLNAMSGPDDNRKRGLKVAQFIPGKGLEIEGVQQHTDASIYCSLGEKSHKLVDSLEETFKTMSGKQVSIDFAFKLVNTPDLRSARKNSRITALNCFRHVNPDSFNYQKTGTYTTPNNDNQKNANLNWHTTLGPDSSYVRRGTDGLATGGTDAGTWRTKTNTARSIGGFAKEWDASSAAWSATSGEAGLANSLVSPYRTPSDFEVMYSRINRQVLENYGFSLNTFKFQSTNGVTATTTPVPVPIPVWCNPGTDVMNFGETSNSTQDDLKASFPATINTQILKNPGKETTESQYYNNYLEYHSQLGSGKLSYQFSNDGTNPVCIDICVVGVKKGETASVDFLKDLCTYNYGVHKYANQMYLNANGYQGNVETNQDKLHWNFANQEWHQDAKLPFIPDECFNNPQSYLDAIGEFLPGTHPQELLPSNVYNTLLQGKKNPFKLVKRDQFIVSSGATRAWNTTLPSIKYRPQLYEDITYPMGDGGNTQTGDDEAKAIAAFDKIAVDSDEYTYILCIGSHGLSTPVEELYPSQTTNPDGTVRQVMTDPGDPSADPPVPPTYIGYEVLRKAIIDHEPTSCSVSVVGTYTETVKPAYPKDVSDRTFINGRLKLPYFASTSPAGDRIESTHHHEYPTRLSSVDIATQGQVVRTTETGITGVGAINANVGA